jgi:subtilisin family serine protease
MRIIKRIIPAVLAAICISVSANAQKTFVKTDKDTKMSSWLYDKYVQQQDEVKKSGGALRAQGRPVRRYVLALVESTDGDATIRQKGGVVLQDFWDGISAAFLPVDSLGTLNQSERIMRMEANEPARIMNDTSAIITGVDKAWAGQGALPQAFTGKGVYAGIMDIGFDFTHPAFRNDDGTSRIQWFWDPAAPDGGPDDLGMIYKSPEMVLAARHTTDATLDEHGTHVMGTMAGNGLDGHYVGMAPEADIIGSYIPISGNSPVDYDYLDARLSDYLKKHLPGFEDLSDETFEMSGSDTWDIVLLYRIFKQADTEGKPCVVNWSYGSPSWFSDDNTLYNALIDHMLGPGHILVAAAGNEGDYPIYFKKEEGEQQEQNIYYIDNDQNYKFQIRSSIDIQDFDLSMTFQDVADTITFDMKEIFDSLTYYQYKIPFPQKTDSDEASDGQIPEIDTILVTVWFRNIINDKVIFQTYVSFPKSYTDTHNLKKGKIIVDTYDEVEFLGLNYNVYFSLDTWYNSRGCHLYTITEQAAIERIIAVGAMHHRTTFINIEGDTIDNGWSWAGSKEGQLVSFSSCGPTMDGRIKPDVVAPGLNILSALNSYYTDVFDDEIAYETEVFGRNYRIFGESGTSMATPMVAGIIALWLQAKPDLTPEDIFGVLERTSHQPEPEFSGSEKNNYYGWGEIDAYAGLLDILGLTNSVPRLSQHQPAGITFRLEGQTLYIDGIDADTGVTVYDLNGRPVVSVTTSDGKIELPALPQGVYAVQIGKLGSTLIRLQ